MLLSDRLLEKKWTYRRSSSERDLTPASPEDTNNDPPPPPLPTTPIPNVVVASSADFSGNNRLSRIFSVRRSGDSSPAIGVPESSNAGPGMHPLPEEEEAMLGVGGGGVGGVAPAVPPPTLPPLPPPLMSPEQTKRRYIVNSLVQSENNYLGV